MVGSRRQFLQQAAGSVLAPSLAGSLARAASDEAPVILLRSGWQTVNIGDITHTPGVLHVIERHLPGAKVILWPNAIDRGVGPMLRRRFPGLRVVREAARDDAMPGDPTLAEAMEQADLLMHGSGPSVVGAKELARWRDATDKPYGIYGVTIGSIPDDGTLRDILEGAAFVYTRETRSLELLHDEQVEGPDLGFVPDGTFAFDIRDDEAADRLLDESGLEADTYLCVVPRLRYTPYWEIRPGSQSPAQIRERKAVNETHAEADHAKLREVVWTWVEQTGLKVLICPEMTYQVDIIHPLVYDPLPASIRDRVVPLNRYWMPDEAASVYRKARAVVSMECHSPIIALAQGTPAFYIQQPTDTWKGQMYPDLGLGDWMFPIDETSGVQIADRLLEVHRDDEGAKAKRDRALDRADGRYRETMGVVSGILKTS